MLYYFLVHLAKVRTRKGLPTRVKFTAQLVVAFAVLQLIFWQPPSAWLPVLAIPFFKGWFVNLGWLWIPFAMLVIVGASNAVNLTDGLDGLAIGPIVMAGAAFGVIAYLTGNFRAADYLKILNVRGAGELSVFCGALIGAAIGFLWFNCHPAEVFMGDAGSLALGAAIGMLAVLTKAELLLPLVGGIYVVEAVSRGRGYLATLAGRRATVVGLAKSGIAAARLLVAAGADVRGTDAKPVASLGPEVAALAAVGVRLVDGSAAFDGVELVVVSPGVPLDGEQLAPARARLVPVIGELELAWRAMEAETIAITGTNGKTTTTALTGALLAEQPRPVFVGGNIGTPLAAHALDFPAGGLVVAEVSSFQLETIEAFQPRVAAVLNVTPDHLDRHRTFARYLDAKARIFMNQTEHDCAVLNADDEAARGLAARTRGHVLWFSRQGPLHHGVFVHDGWLVAKLNGHVDRICPLTEIQLRGAHNVENVLAATACALWTGIA